MAFSQVRQYQYYKWAAEGSTASRYFLAGDVCSVHCFSLYLHQESCWQDVHELFVTFGLFISCLWLEAQLWSKHGGVLGHKSDRIMKSLDIYGSMTIEQTSSADEDRVTWAKAQAEQAGKNTLRRGTPSGPTPTHLMLFFSLICHPSVDCSGSVFVDLVSSHHRAPGVGLASVLSLWSYIHWF